jgi:tetratricopeptide (TPR) repeat protein
MATKVAGPPKAERRPRREAMPDTPDPIEIAMVAAVSGKPIPNVARRILEEQADFIHAQRDEIRLRHIGELVRAALWAILAVAALAIVGLLGALIYHASRADSLIVESFRVPPAMAQQGLTGDVVATEVLDKIAEFQDKTDSVRAATSYDNNWGDDLKIDIPNTGATADQIWKLLRGWLGKETRISGEIVDSKGGLALTARVGASPGQRFVTKDGDLDSLVLKAAEHIMSQTQPYRYVWHLRDSGRNDEAYALLQQLTADPSPVERKWAYNGLAVMLRGDGELARSLASAEQAVRIDAGMIPARINVGYDLHFLGRDQQALDMFESTLKIPNDGEYVQRIMDANACTELEDIGQISRDPEMLQRALQCYSTAPPSYRSSAPLTQAELTIIRHDVPAMLAFNQQPSAFYTPAETTLNNADMRLRGLIESGAPTLSQALEAFRSAEARTSAANAPFARAIETTYSLPLQTTALVKLGRTREAAALIAKTPLDCYDCILARGLVAEAQGDLPSAQRWFAEAVKQGPRLAPAYVDWGRLLVRARRFDPAVAKLSRAADLSANWADPLKYWGDALAAQGKRDDALAKYDAALKLAPNWQELQQARARLGRTA